MRTTVHNKESFTNYVIKLETLVNKKNKLQTIENTLDFLDDSTTEEEKNSTEYIEKFRTLMTDRFTLMYQINDLERELIDFERESFYED